MNISSSRGRAPRRLAFFLALIVSGCAQIVLLVASTSLAAVPGQKQPPASRAGANQDSQRGAETNFTRPRRIESQTGVALHTSSSAAEPIVRVALMTEVTSVTLTSPYGLIVRRAEKSSDEGKRIASGSLRIELRQQAEALASKSAAAYSVRVATFSESRRARKLSDELKKIFFEPVTTTFSQEQKEYSVVIGRFAARADAVRLAERLRTAGYDELRIVTDPATIADSASGANARAAKYKAQSSSAIRSAVRSDRHPIQLVATSADKVADSSENGLVVSPIQRPFEKAEDSRADSSARNQESWKPTKPRGQTDPVVSVAASPASVRVAGKDYRGHIHLLLSPRGRINVVNSLPLEEYLRGVVPVELSPGVYPEIEALKAQAVAARSYALARLGQHRDQGFDLVDDTRAQVYGGLSAERELSNRAVAETRGLVAVYPNDEGKLVPIEALYTSNCGGRTENNEEVFGGTPLPYLRGVACAPDQESVAGREIVTKLALETLTGIEGRSIAREVGLLSVLGFSLPRRVTSQYLRSASDQAEVKGWVEHIARFSQKERPRLQHGSATRLAEFIHFVALSVYGEGRVSTLLAPADVDYLLGGLPVRDLPREARADVAMLLRDGILQLPGGVLDWRAIVTRGQAIEIVARAVSLKAQPKDLKSQFSIHNSQFSNSNPRIPEFKSDICARSEKGRLIFASLPGSTSNNAGPAPGSRFQSINATATTRPPRSDQDAQREGKAVSALKDDAGTSKISEPDDPQPYNQPEGIEIAEDAWLFRKLGGASYAVDRLSLIGGEHVTYHLNARGKIDFLEASPSDRGAASDRFSSVALWQERVAVEDLQQRLAGARVNVGRIDNIEPVAFSSSNRITEVEITGDKNHVRIHRPQIRAALGVKEYLFVVDRETDANGRVVAFVFTGRGWGHGVGMCQIGAYGLAKEGYSHAGILQKYYTGIRLRKMY